MAKAITAKTWTFTGAARATYSSDNLSGVSGSFQLPTDNYIPQKLAGRILSPRPDVETATNSNRAYYRKNHSQMDYRVRISTKGMAWPLQFSLTTAPAGATIGGELTRSTDGVTGKTLHTWGADYAWVTVPKASMPVGTATFGVSVKGQDGLTQTIAWTSEREDSAFVFLNGTSGSDVAAGTYAAPLKTFATGLWESSDAASTYAGKIAVFRGSDIYAVGMGAPTTNVTLNTTVKPATYMAFPGETPTLDTSDSHFFSNGTNQTDLSVIDLKIDGSRSTVNNVRIFNLGAVSDRQNFLGLTFSNIASGVVANDNPCCIGHFDNSTKRKDIVVADCVITSTVDCELWVGFACDGVLLENNTGTGLSITAANSNYALRAKDDCDNITIRANVFQGSIGRSVIAISNQNTTGDFSPPANQEICYNRVASTVGILGGAIEWNGSSSSPDGTNTHDFRNSSVEANGYAYRFYGNASPTPVTLVASAYAGTNGDINGTNYTNGTPASVALSVNGGTAVTARTDHLGLKGAEVAA